MPKKRLLNQALQQKISLEQIRQSLEQWERQNLSCFATYSSEGIRRHPEPYSGYRQIFSSDADRILNSRAYTRYIDKTQVFSFVNNDHITHRVLHVQLVSKIARTISRFLRLNEDLTEAIALGHDIGHTPFGHNGEVFLSEICQEHHIGYFCHNIQSVQFLDKVERKGKGLNLCLQTLDGILCHDGEIHNQTLSPCRGKTFETLGQEIVDKKNNPKVWLYPMTSEGCVVRFADTISYIGRDIEDAIRLNLIQRSDIPKDCVSQLGDTNGTIVYTLATDIIQNSFGQDYIAFSPEISETLKKLKQFNYERIYFHPTVRRYSDKVRTLFRRLFDQYLEDIRRENYDSAIFSGFLKDMSQEYISEHKAEEIVRDFIAGMTDHYFLRQCPKDEQYFL